MFHTFPTCSPYNSVYFPHVKPKITSVVSAPFDHRQVGASKTPQERWRRPCGGPRCGCPGCRAHLSMPQEFEWRDELVHLGCKVLYLDTVYLSIDIYKYTHTHIYIYIHIHMSKSWVFSYHDILSRYLSILDTRNRSK